MSIFDVVFNRPELRIPHSPIYTICDGWVDIFLVPAFLLLLALVLMIFYKKNRILHGIVLCLMFLNLWSMRGETCGATVPGLILKGSYRFGFGILPLSILLIYLIPFVGERFPKVRRYIKWLMITILVIGVILSILRFLIVIFLYL